MGIACGDDPRPPQEKGPRGAGRPAVHGQLGHGGLESRTEPQPLEALQGVPVEEVAAGGWHSAALTEAGDLYLWGWNESGQLALPSKTVAAAESQASMAADEAGTGDAENRPPDPLGATFISIQALPALLDLPDGAEVRKVSCGSRHTAALTRAGDLYTWGWGQYGQLGHGDAASSDRPRKVGCFADWNLCVVDVTCGPWATYAQTERRTTDQRQTQPEA
ncbi:hypothetical protein JD844_014800 [Phrynosoma platyrhinos]|uniref:RCC1 domain-containing protein 1 n=1 Tax=Phrynosoma platyrhinos TaxID=52577 RepID=A0ABQ7SS35_PHRPL|nr:hypothetical protein JD844_014800 [Phrynosoma platyrhinos]